jgi:hypothetical protein
MQALVVHVVGDLLLSNTPKTMIPIKRPTVTVLIATNSLDDFLFEIEVINKRKFALLAKSSLSIIEIQDDSLLFNPNPIYEVFCVFFMLHYYCK